MLSFLQRHKGLVVVGALLLLPAVMLYAQTRSGGGRGPVVRTMLDVTGVIERGMLWVSGGIFDGVEHYLGSIRSYEELAKLRQERIVVAVLETRVSELSIENERLRGLANAAAEIDGPRPLGARVIGRTGMPLARLVTLDKGTSDGVRRGDGVVSIQGVVGVVLTAGRAHSDVLLLTDPASAIDVVVQRSRARGIVRGRGDNDKYAAIVEDFDRLREVQRGDAVVTSGIGARFPPGLLVGQIVDVDDHDDLTLTAIIRPAVRLSRLEHVEILIGREAPVAPTLGDDAPAVSAPERRFRRRPKKPTNAPKGDATTSGGSSSAAASDDADVDFEPATPPPRGAVDAGMVRAVDAGAAAAPSPPALEPAPQPPAPVAP